LIDIKTIKNRAKDKKRERGGKHIISRQRNEAIIAEQQMARGWKNWSRHKKNELGRRHYPT